MFFIDGTFHGDPHPGNMLVNSEGALIILDFGQAKTFTREERRLLCELIIALADDDDARIVECTKRMGYRSKNDKNVTFLFVANMLFDTAPYAHKASRTEEVSRISVSAWLFVAGRLAGVQLVLAHSVLPRDSQ